MRTGGGALSEAGPARSISVGECISALSSLMGGELAWAQSAIGSAAEGCELMFPVY